MVSITVQFFGNEKAAALLVQRALNVQFLHVKVIRRLSNDNLNKSRKSQKQQRNESKNGKKEKSHWKI